MARRIAVVVLPVVLVVVCDAVLSYGQTADHLKCYKVHDPLLLSGTVDLDSPQFGVDPGCKIARGTPALFCVPARKTVVAVRDRATGQPITPLPISGTDPGDRLCYKIKCDASPPDIEVTDQFGTRTLSGLRAKLLCTPAVKGGPPTTTTSTTTTTTTTSTTTTTLVCLIDCNDGNACTDDTCDPAARFCIYTVIDCNDHNACTIDDCDPFIGCIYTDVSCDDQNACTNDFCDPNDGCFYTLLSGTPCDGGTCQSGVCETATTTTTTTTTSSTVTTRPPGCTACGGAGTPCTNDVNGFPCASGVCDVIEQCCDTGAIDVNGQCCDSSTLCDENGQCCP